MPRAYSSILAFACAETRDGGAPAAWVRAEAGGGRSGAAETGARARGETAPAPTPAAFDGLPRRSPGGEGTRHGRRGVAGGRRACWISMGKSLLMDFMSSVLSPAGLGEIRRWHFPAYALTGLWLPVGCGLAWRAPNP